MNETNSRIEWFPHTSSPSVFYACICIHVPDDGGFNRQPTGHPGSLKASGTGLSSLQMILYIPFFQQGSLSLPVQMAE